MADVIFVLVVAGFFALALALVAACDRIAPGDPPGGDTASQPKERP